MVLKENSSEQKLRGAYYTPYKLAGRMVEIFADDESISTILEPSCGDGVFVDAVIQQNMLDGLREITAIEIEKPVARELSERKRCIPC